MIDSPKEDEETVKKIRKGKPPHAPKKSKCFRFVLFCFTICKTLLLYDTIIESVENMLCCKISRNRVRKGKNKIKNKIK